MLHVSKHTTAKQATGRRPGPDPLNSKQPPPDRVGVFSCPQLPPGARIGATLGRITPGSCLPSWGRLRRPGR